MLASELNLQLGRCAKWKVRAGRRPRRKCPEIHDIGMLPAPFVIHASLTKELEWLSTKTGAWSGSGLQRETFKKYGV